ncbi:MAG: heavy metal translocating P-type ATPase [Treponema sp.]|uniref:heavy metal translocating P-type ATPase n=1 Tax=Treponema sp. TaxID=166 RepID=UPI00298DA10C|nr:heavy metal translocating P-type ATPase [Treponema sp.]MBR5932754.1 heavy metal translocating P-type ATPase [Treponema sp.]
MEKFDVTGMSCAACSAHVQKAVESVEGVTSCNVNLLTNSMTVEGNFDDNLTQKIMSAVQKAGYGAKPAGAPHVKTKSSLDAETKKLLKRFFVSVCILLPLMYVSMGHMMWGWPIPSFIKENFFEFGRIVFIGIYQAILSFIILFINRKFFISGTKAVLNRAPNMDTLVALGSGVSYLYSLYNLVSFAAAFYSVECSYVMPALYFESAAMIVTLITVGKTLESFSKGKTTDALNSLIKLAPQTATIFKDGTEKTVGINQVKAGDVVVVKTGESIPVDGIITEGSASINESNLTGESIPLDKGEGKSVYASTLCVTGRIVVKVEKIGQETSFGKIIQLVTDASSSKAPIAKIADKVSAVFVPSVLLISLITFAVWFFIGVPGSCGMESLSMRLSNAVALAVCVLVISCPCSLGLATPVSIMVGNGVAAKKGILFKTAASLEALGKVEICVMDKTGTVTNGKPVVTDVELNEELLLYVYSLEKNSSHPLAVAVSKYCEKRGTALGEVCNFEEIIGRGVKAVIDGKLVKAGNIEFVPDAPKELIEKKSREGKTPLLFSIDEKYVGMICVSDTEKETSRQAVKELNGMGIETVLLTGDNKATADAIAQRVGIKKVYAGVKPDEKEKIVAELSKDKKVAMTGDGVNDAPSLKRSFVGIAIGAGTDVALDAADVVLMKNDLLDVVRGIKISKNTLRNIHENLFWAFFYNIICIPVAAGALGSFGIFLKPVYGALAMSLSSFCVVMNSLRLNFMKTDKGDSVMKKTIQIKGMMCQHCQKHVTDALCAIEGVKADVDFKAGTAVVEYSGDISDDVFKKAVVDAGYEFVEIS